MAGAASALTAPSAAAAPDVSTYAYSLARDGLAPAASAIPARAAKHLKLRWRAKLDGAINTQPLVAHGVRAGGKRRDLVYVGTEHGVVAALNAHSGRVVWRRRLGWQHNTEVMGCAPSPDESYGITSTPTLDRRAGLLYAVDGLGRAWALGLGDGRSAPGWPVQVTRPADHEYVWGALALAGGRLYVTVGSYCDHYEYEGGMVSVDTADPASTRRWDTMGASGLPGGGIWTWGGSAVGPDGTVYVATGNANPPAQEESAQLGEHVVALDPDLGVVAADAPLRGPFAQTDRDLSSTPMLMHARGCPLQLVTLAKTGEMFLYDGPNLSGGPAQRLHVTSSSAGQIPLIGQPSFDPSTRLLVFLKPDASSNRARRRGLVGYRLTRSCRLARRWSVQGDGVSSGAQPTLAGGVAFVASGYAGTVRAYRVANGARLWVRRFDMAVYAEPTVADGRLYVADWRGRVFEYAARRAFYPSRRALP